MPQKVRFPDYGNSTIEFPDDMSQDQINQAVENEVLPQLKQKFGEPQKDQQTLAESYETPDFLKAENIPSGKELRDTIAATPEVGDRLITSMIAGSGAIGAEMAGKVAGAFTEETQEEAVEMGEKWGRTTSRFIDLMLHGGIPKEERQPSPEAETSIKAMEAVMRAPKEYLFEPAGELVEKVTGSKIAGSLTEDSMDVLFWTLAPIKLKEFTGKAVRKIRARRKRAAPETREAPEVREGEALKQEEVRKTREEEVQEAFEGTEAARETGEALEKRKRLEDAEEIRQRELEARQKLYEDFFDEKNVKEYVDDVEKFIDRKAKGEAPRVSREEVEILYDNWLERMKNKKSEFKKDWENWQKEKAKLDAEGIKPAPDLFRALQQEIGPEGKGLPPGYSDLKFGVETQRPYPQIAETEPLVKAPGSKYTQLQREKLGYKKDYSIQRKMKPTGRRKVHSREEFNEITSTETDPTTQQGTALVRTGEEIIRDLESQGIEVPQQQALPSPEVRDYVPPKTPEDAFISSEKLAERERMIREVYKRKQAEKQARGEELEALKREQAEDMGAEQTVEESLMPEEPEARAARDIDEYLTETDWEPQGRTPFEESLDMEDPRPLNEMLEDWKTVIAEDWKSQRGSISFEKLSKTQTDAINRLEKDIITIKRNAAKAGKRISQYLMDARFTVDPKVAQYIEENADRISPDRATKIETSSRGGNGKAVADMFDRAERAERKGAKTWKERMGDIGSKVWAVDAKVRKFLEEDPSWEARKVLENKINSKGATAWGQDYFNKASEKIFNHLTSHEKRALDRLINARSKLDIARRHGPNTRDFPEGVKTEDYAAFLKDAKQQLKLTEESFRRVNQAANDYFDVTRDLLNKKYQAGAVPDWLYELLKANEYSPIRYQELLDNSQVLMDTQGTMDVRRPPKNLEDFETMVKDKVGAEEYNVKSTNIRRLSGGKKGYERLNSEQLLSGVIFNTTDWIMKNYTSKSLGRYAENVPNDVVKPGKVKKSRVGKYGDVHEYFEEAPEGYKSLHYFENGEKKTIYAQDWFAEQWRNSNKEVSHDLAGVLRFMSGAPALRQMATGAGNPGFFLKGLPMDMATIYMNAQKRGADGSYRSVYSNHIPKFIPQIASDMARVAPDVFMKKGRYVDAVEDGLTMSWLSEGGTPSGARTVPTRGLVGKAKSGLEGIHDWLSYLNRNTELVTRHAVRERLIREGYSREAATAAARDYLDYSQGGSAVKAVDNVVPYFNVAVQAGRTTLRSAKRDWKGFSVKAGELMAMASAIDAIARAIDEDAKKAESDYNKENYFIIPTGMSFKDDFGNKQKMNLKIRKEPALAPLFTTAELINAAAFGDEVEGERLWNSVHSAIPNIGPTLLPPSASGMVAYTLNSNPFTMEKIWKGGNVPPEKEWRAEESSRFWKDVGEASGASPERLKASFEQVATHGNMFANLAGKSYDHLVNKLETQDQEFLTANFAAENFGSEFLSVVPETRVNWDYMDKADKEQNGKRFANNQMIDRLAKEYYMDESIEYEKIKDFIDDRDPEEQKRLYERLRNFTYLQNTNLSRNFWQGVGAADNPKSKARLINRELMEADPEKREQMEEDLYYLKASPSRIIPQTDEADFWREFFKVRGEKTWED